MMLVTSIICRGLKAAPTGNKTYKKQRRGAGGDAWTAKEMESRWKGEYDEMLEKNFVSKTKINKKSCLPTN